MAGLNCPLLQTFSSRAGERAQFIPPCSQAIEMSHLHVVYRKEEGTEAVGMAVAKVWGKLQ